MDVSKAGVQRRVTTIERDGEKVHILTIVNEQQLGRILERVWDPGEFRSEFGLRSLSKFHEQHPFVFGANTVMYEPAESSSHRFIDEWRE